MSLSEVPMQKQYAEVLGRRMAYVDVGAGDPIVFLHGNPTSSYLWRNVIPHLQSLGRCVAPDLIGMGDSDKLPVSGPGSYRFVEHRRYLDALLEQIGVRDRVTLVIHDWGSALGFDWASRHRDAVKGIAYMEAIVRPLSWQEWPDAARGVFEGFRSEAGDDMILNKNMFVERVLPASVLRTLTEEEMQVYRAPFKNPGEDRRPALTWPQEIPIDGEPADVCAIVSEYGDWLASSPLPKLFVNADPGSILTGPQREWVRSWPHQHEVTVPGSHFLQEDSPDAIGEAIADWYAELNGLPVPRSTITANPKPLDSFKPWRAFEMRRCQRRVTIIESGDLPPVSEPSALAAASCLLDGFSEPARLIILQHLALNEHRTWRRSPRRLRPDRTATGRIGWMATRSGSGTGGNILRG